MTDWIIFVLQLSPRDDVEDKVSDIEPLTVNRRKRIKNSENKVIS